MAPPIQTRRATAEDLDQLLAHVQAGFDTYGSFAPAAWRPRNVMRGREVSADLFADPATWTLIAFVGGAPTGHVAFFPGRERDPGQPRLTWTQRPLVPGLAHLWQLFVLPEWWGTGVAPLLHDAATSEMRAQGYAGGRLFTPTGHSRARRFYERRGWVAGSAEWNDVLELDLTEYRLQL